MGCLFSGGIARTCGYSFGGVKKMYIANRDHVTNVANSTADDSVTGITMSGSTKFYTFQFEPNTGQLLQELQAGSASRFFNQTINGQFANITQAKKNVLEDLGNAYAIVIIQDQADNYWLAGEDGVGLLAATLTFDTGLAQTDAYVANISLVGGSRTLANSVSSSIIASIIV